MTELEVVRIVLATVGILIAIGAASFAVGYYVETRKVHKFALAIAALNLIAALFNVFVD